MYRTIRLYFHILKKNSEIDHFLAIWGFYQNMAKKWKILGEIVCLLCAHTIFSKNIFWCHTNNFAILYSRAQCCARFFFCSPKKKCPKISHFADILKYLFFWKGEKNACAACARAENAPKLFIWYQKIFFQNIVCVHKRHTDF